MTAFLCPFAIWPRARALGAIVLTLAGLSRCEAAGAPIVVKGRGGPILLELRIASARVSSADQIRVQICLTNRSSTSISVPSEGLRDPEMLREASRERFGVYLELSDRRGRIIHPTFSLEQVTPDTLSSQSNPDEAEQRRLQALVRQWQSEGLDDQAINIRLMEQEAADSKRSVVKEVPFAPKARKCSVMSPLNMFGELSPGVFVLRAVYTAGSDDVFKRYSIPRRPEDLTVRTPWATIELR